MTLRLINKSLLAVWLASSLVACSQLQNTTASTDPNSAADAYNVSVPHNTALTKRNYHQTKSTASTNYTTASTPDSADNAATNTSSNINTNTNSANNNTNTAGDPPADPPADPADPSAVTTTVNGDPSSYVQLSQASGSGNLWDELKTGFQLDHDTSNAAVQAQIAWYMQHQGYLYRTTKRAAPYMYYIYQQVHERNLPTELVLLPIMESAYNPFASSNRGAAGLWQLERGTASAFGVRQDWWYDGRRDVLASTNAALDYLTYLQSFFGGNWVLAIAAYDAGEGTIQEAVRRNARDGLGTDFWSLPLNAETRAYIPRLLALASIIDNPKEYPVDLPPISDSPYLGEVDIGGQINLEQAANLAGISLDELKQLNPGYSHHTTDPNGPHKLLLPFDKIQTFQEHLLDLSHNQTSMWGRYKVQEGDTLESVSKQFNTSEDILQQVNRLHSNELPVGTVILIPENSISTLNAPSTDNNDDSATGNDADSSNTSLSNNASNTYANNEENSLAENSGNSNTDSDSANNETNSADMTNNVSADATGTSSNTLAAADTNNGSVSANSNSPDALDQATNLYNMSNTASDDDSEQNSSPQQQRISHTIRSGETLASIARQYRVSANDLRRWNRINAKHLKPGMKISIIYTANINSSSPERRHADKILVTIHGKHHHLASNNLLDQHTSTGRINSHTTSIVHSGNNNKIKIAHRANQHQIIAQQSLTLKKRPASTSSIHHANNSSTKKKTHLTSNTKHHPNKKPVTSTG